MTAVVVPYHSDKAVIRCVIPKVSGQNLCGEARKRFINHERWLQIKTYDQKLQQERKKLVEERENQKREQLAEELKRKEIENQQKVQQWLKEKFKECEKKKETVIVNVKKGGGVQKETKVGNHIIQEWAKFKAEQKKIELRENEEQRKLEEEKRNKRQALSGLCYEQWKEKAKQKQVAIPRNGYQIFAPKPEPVVRDEWVTLELPKRSPSIPSINNSKLFIISSFRSEPQMLVEHSFRSYISKLDLDSSSAPLTPWGQVTGGYHARGVTKRAPALTWTDRTAKDSMKDVKKQRKKPHFRP